MWNSLTKTSFLAYLLEPNFHFYCQYNAPKMRRSLIIHCVLNPKKNLTSIHIPASHLILVELDVLTFSRRAEIIIFLTLLGQYTPLMNAVKIALNNSISSSLPSKQNNRFPVALSLNNFFKVMHKPWMMEPVSIRVAITPGRGKDGPNRVFHFVDVLQKI